MRIKTSYILYHLLGKFRRSEYDRARSKWFYFLHIPKTAGTSFRHVFYENFSQKEIYPNYYELNVKQKAAYFRWQKFLENESYLFPKSKKILVGHFGWKPIIHYQNHKPYILTFLREPLARVKSSIIYHQLRNRKYAPFSVDDIIDRHLISEGCLQARQLGYHLRRANLDMVLNNLESLDFIGISERFDESLALCNDTFGWNLKPTAKQNVGEYTDEVFTIEQIERIRKACEIDYVIYNRGLELFEQRLSQMKKGLLKYNKPL